LDNHLLNEKRYNKKPSISRVQDFDPAVQGKRKVLRKELTFCNRRFFSFKAKCNLYDTKKGVCSRKSEQ